MARRGGKKVQAGRDPPRVVVVGVGFGGLATVKRLARAGLSVTLVDRNIYSTFQPLLYQVATAGLSPADVSYPVRGFARKYGPRFRHRELTNLHPPPRRITPAHAGQL